MANYLISCKFRHPFQASKPHKSKDAALFSTDYLVVEGITDYYALRLAEAISDNRHAFNLVPGTGSGASGPIISQMLGQGMSFAILLDDDKAGRKSRDIYRETWFLPNASVITLSGVHPSYENMAIEGLLGQETLNLARQRLELEQDPTKKQLGWYLAESFASNDISALPQSAVDRLVTVLDYFHDHFKLDQSASTADA